MDVSTLQCRCHILLCNDRGGGQSVKFVSGKLIKPDLNYTSRECLEFEVKQEEESDMSGACWKLLSIFEYWKWHWEVQIWLQISVYSWGRGKSSSSLKTFAILGGLCPLLPSIPLFHVPCIYWPLFIPCSYLVIPFPHLPHPSSHNKHLFFFLTLIPELHCFCFWGSSRTIMESKRICCYLGRGSSSEPPWGTGDATLNILVFPNTNKGYMNKRQGQPFPARNDNANSLLA